WGRKTHEVLLATYAFGILYLLAAPIWAGLVPMLPRWALAWLPLLALLPLLPLLALLPLLPLLALLPLLPLLALARLRLTLLGITAVWSSLRIDVVESLLEIGVVGFLLRIGFVGSLLGIGVWSLLGLTGLRSSLHCLVIPEFSIKLGLRDISFVEHP